MELPFKKTVIINLCEKAEKRTGFIGVLFLPAVGVAFIAASVVFSVLFLQAA